MKTIFEKQHMKFTRKGGSVLTVRKDGVSYEDVKKAKKSFDISFNEISYIIALSYCNSNSNYNLLFEKKISQHQ